MKKKFLVSALILILVLSCTSCEEDKNDNGNNNGVDEYFDYKEILLNDDTGETILVDKNTNVMYYKYSCVNRSGITPIYNADGTLKLYKDEEN